MPILTQPGDVLFHNILTLHGSGPARSWFRRVLYYEFRAAETERRVGPHHPRYIALKQRALLGSLRTRQPLPYAAAEKPFVYRPTRGFAPVVPADEDAPTTYRFPHNEYWRTA